MSRRPEPARSTQLMSALARRLPWTVPFIGGIAFAAMGVASAGPYEPADAGGSTVVDAAAHIGADARSGAGANGGAGAGVDAGAGANDGGAGNRPRHVPDLMQPPPPSEPSPRPSKAEWQTAPIATEAASPT